MDAYTSFAAVYDTFMDNIPYEEWKSYLKELLKEYGVQDGLVLDLGCGTGTMTELLAADGYDMIGVDNSEEMLEIAREKQIKSGHEILYLLQDMREFELYGTVGAVFSICDSLNYITEPEELKQVFRWVNNYLDPGGIFIFDFNTEYKYREVLGDQTIAEAREDCSFIWDNYYYEEERINEYELNLFIREDAESETEGVLGDQTIAEAREDCSFIWDNYYYEEERINEYELNLFIREDAESETEGDLYRRFRETHFQRAYTLEEITRIVEESGLQFVTAYEAFTKAYTLEEITRIVEESGLQFVTAYEAFTKEPPSKNSERIYVIAREQGKVSVKKAE